MITIPVAFKTKTPALFIFLFSSMISNTALAYSCALEHGVLPVLQPLQTYPNSGFAVLNWPLEKDHDLDETNASKSTKQIKIFTQQQQLVPYTIRPLISGYSWLQPTATLEKNQHYLIDQSDYSTYSGKQEDATSSPNIDLEIADQAFQPHDLHTIRNSSQISFKHSKFADANSFGYGGWHTMDFELINAVNLQDYFIHVRLKNYTQNKSTDFILQDRSSTTPKQMTLHFINDICAGNLDFFPNEKWQIQIDLISPTGQVLPNITAPLIFNTSGESHLSFWDKISNWWQKIKLKWL